MAGVIHFLTIPLHDVMTLVASGSRWVTEIPRLTPTLMSPAYDGCYRLVVDSAAGRLVLELGLR